MIRTCDTCNQVLSEDETSLIETRSYELLLDKELCSDCLEQRIDARHNILDNEIGLSPELALVFSVFRIADEAKDLQEWKIPAEHITEILNGSNLELFRSVNYLSLWVSSELIRSLWTLQISRSELDFLISLGLEPVSLRHYEVLGITSIEEIIAWHRLDVLLGGLSTEALRSWQAWKTFPSRILSLVDESYLGEDTGRGGPSLAFRDAGLPLEEALEWVKAGFSADGMDVDGLNHPLGHHFSLWLEEGFSPRLAKSFIDEYDRRYQEFELDGRLFWSRVRMNKALGKAMSFELLDSPD